MNIDTMLLALIGSNIATYQGYREAMKIARGQRRLIDRLLCDNARLAGGGGE